MQTGDVSLVFNYEKTLPAFGSGDGEVLLHPSLGLPGNDTPKYIRLVQARFSKYLANVFAIKTPFVYDNTWFRWTMDGGATWNKVILRAGKYDLALIQDALIGATAQTWTSKSDPGFIIAPDLATGRVYIRIINSKAASATPARMMGLDFSSNTASPNIAEFLGLSTAPGAATFLNDTNALAPNAAQINLCGDEVSIRVNAFGPLTNKNGELSEELCSVPLMLWSPTVNEYVTPLYPSELPLIMLSGGVERVHRFGVSLVGSRYRENVPWPVFFTEGTISVTYQIIFGASRQ